MHKKDFEVIVGDTFRQSLRWKVGATKETAMPVDISSHTAKMQVWGDDPLAPLFELTTENGGIVKGPDVGVLWIVLTATQTASVSGMKPSRYDMQLTAANGDVKTLISGHMRWKRDVTK